MNNELIRNKKIIIVIFLILIIICVGAFIYFKFVKTHNNETNNLNNQNIINNNTTNETDLNNNTPDDDFSMTIEDVYTITGRGTVVSGKVESGTINVNDSVQIVGPNNEVTTATVTSIEMLRKSLSSATAGDRPGLLLNGIEKDSINIGDVLTRANP